MMRFTFASLLLALAPTAHAADLSMLDIKDVPLSAPVGAISLKDSSLSVQGGGVAIVNATELTSLRASAKKIAAEPIAIKSDPGTIASLESVLHPEDKPQGGSIRGRRATKTATKWDKGFLANVVGPVDLKSLLGPIDHDHSRRLQAECFELDDGSIACVVDDIPADGFLTIFFDCPRSGSSVLECAGCVIVAADSLATFSANDPQCNACSICSDTIAFDCTNLVSGDCASQSCTACTNGGGDPPSSSPTPAPTPAQGTASGGTAECFQTTDGPAGTEVVCFIDDAPGDGFVMVFFCPSTAQTTLDCLGCAIVASENINTISSTDPTCSSCTICSERVSWECSNVASGECADVDCAGTCAAIQDPSPTPFPTPFPTESQATPVPTPAPTSDAPGPSNPLFPPQTGPSETTSGATGHSPVMLISATFLGMVVSLAM